MHWKIFNLTQVYVFLELCFKKSKSKKNLDNFCQGRGDAVRSTVSGVEKERNKRINPERFFAFLKAPPGSAACFENGTMDNNLKSRWNLSPEPIGSFSKDSPSRYSRGWGKGSNTVWNKTNRMKGVKEPPFLGKSASGPSYSVFRILFADIQVAWGMSNFPPSCFYHSSWYFPKPL